SEDGFDAGRTECSNELDDDGDGLFDLADPDCENMEDNTEYPLVWDNYHGEEGYDTSLNAFVSSVEYYDSWAGDDAMFEQCVVVNKVKWMGARYRRQLVGTVEFRLMDAVYDPDACGHPWWWDYWWSCGWNILEERYVESELSYLARPTGDTVEGYSVDLDVYEGTADLPDLVIPAGHSYYSVAVEGYPILHHHILVSTEGDNYGLTEGYAKNPSTGAPEPKPYSIIQFNGHEFDFAYQLYGYLADQTSAECRVCGDGVVQDGEGCDDGGICDDNGASCTLGDLSNCENPSEVNCIPEGGDGCTADCGLEAVPVPGKGKIALSPEEEESILEIIRRLLGFD
ncbi:MAG: hypothetical protein ABIH92_04845, partial [Nanoarchaeota archaeon]